MCFFRSYRHCYLMMVGVMMGVIGGHAMEPMASDDRLQVELVAAEPRVVTPIGIAVDQRNRLFVVESHTHHRPQDYQGPEKDVVKLFVDADGDGIPEKSSVFAEGLQSAMSLAFSPEGKLYLVHRAGVMILHDEDDDGVCERTSEVVGLETTEKYPHNGLSGIVFSRDGWLYLGIGENFGVAYTLCGTDGRRLSTEPGRGGKVFRCRVDGSELEEVAAGFWNPFGLELDRANRLFAVDNDPGGRPPCRLLHVVRGGDYGYKRRYDDGNTFNGWNGELPGTLPMMAGVGESPCGIMSTDRLALPKEYAGALLVASWGDAAIELYRPQKQGASFRATKEVLISAERKFNEAFCPVYLAAAPDGSLYISDWADRTSYPVHGKGRIWRVSVKKGNETVLTYGKELAETNEEALRFARINDEKVQLQETEWKQALQLEDPFLQSAVIGALSRPDARETVQKALQDEDAAVRLVALLALWRSGEKEVLETVRAALEDEDKQVRFAALWWAGEEGMVELKDEIAKAVLKQPTAELFQAYLTASELLEDVSQAEAKKEDAGLMAKTKLAVRQEILTRVLHDDATPVALQAMAAAMVSHLDDKIVARLLHFANSSVDVTLRREAVRTLGAASSPEVAVALKVIILDQTLPAGLRADAMLSLSRCDPGLFVGMAGLLDDESAEVQLEAARAMRAVAHDEVVKSKLEQKLKSANVALTQQLKMALQMGDERRPTTEAAWKEVLQKPGDADAGERVFLSVSAGCTMCHQVRGRGVSIGPNLSYVARSLDRERLIEAILVPSREVAPQYEHQLVTTKDGKVYSGVLVHSALDGAPLMDALGVGRVRVPKAQVELHVTSTLSMMPAGLENTMTVQDFRDLLSYLLTLR